MCLQRLRGTVKQDRPFHTHRPIGGSRLFIIGDRHRAPWDGNICRPRKTPLAPPQLISSPMAVSWRASGGQGTSRKAFLLQQCQQHVALDGGWRRRTFFGYYCFNVNSERAQPCHHGLSRTEVNHPVGTWQLPLRLGGSPISPFRPDGRGELPLGVPWSWMPGFSERMPACPHTHSRKGRPEPSDRLESRRPWSLTQ